MKTKGRKPLKIKIHPPYLRLEHAPSCQIVEGYKVFSENPGEIVARCNGYENHRRACASYTPTFLLKHHVHENLELWQCRGCPDRLIKIDTKSLKIN